MHTAIETLGLDKLFVIYPGNDPYPLSPKIQALPLSQFHGV